MTEAKSAQPQLPPRPERVMDEIGFYTLYQAHEVDAYMNVLEAENISLRSQIVQGDGSCDHCGRVPAIIMPTSLCEDCVNGIKRAEKVEAENESLKAQLRPKCPGCLSVRMSHCSDPSNCGGVYWPDHMYRALEAERDKAVNEANQLRLAFVLSDSVLPAEFEPTLPPTKRLHVYIDKALEVIRGYRQLHSKELGCFGGFNELSSVLYADKRCPTCIKADALLSKEETK